jgi:hypothetical protein
VAVAGLAALATLGALTTAGTPQAEWRVSLRAAGPIRFGMPLREARRLLQDRAPRAPSSVDCDYWSPPNVPPGVSFLVEGGRVMRIDVDSATVPTASGARVGDSEARILELYGDRLQRRPHQYLEGSYLTYVPRDAADTNFRLVFETDGRRVTSYRAGRRPTVEYIEGCS